MGASMERLAIGGSSSGSWRFLSTQGCPAVLLGHTCLLAGCWLLDCHELLHGRALMMRRRKVGIAHGHLDCLVADEIGDGPEINSRHGQARGESVARAVPLH